MSISINLPQPPSSSLSSSFFNSSQYGFNSSIMIQPSSIDDCIYGILGVHITGLLFFMVLLLPMGFLLVSKWKHMVFNKRLLYILLILICLNQIVFQCFGITYTVGLITAMQGWFWTFFHAFETSGMMISVTLCMNSQATIAKIIYNIYFNKTQSWMRKNRLNQTWGKVVKISSISLVIILNILLLLFIVTVCTLFMLRYAETAMTILISEQAETVSSTLGLFVSLGMLYFTILNVVSVGALVRKLLPANRPISKERKTACRKLIALSIGQLLTSLLNIISNIILILKIIFSPAKILLASSIIHKVSIGILCLLVTFAFGPLDNISFEMKKKQQETDTITTVSTYKEPKSSQSSTNSDVLKLENQSKQSTTPISPYYLSTPNSPCSIISNEELLSNSLPNNRNNFINTTLFTPETSPPTQL